jgi:hypothetical protein
MQSFVFVLEYESVDGSTFRMKRGSHKKFTSVNA